MTKDEVWDFCFLKAKQGTVHPKYKEAGEAETARDEVSTHPALSDLEDRCFHT